MDELFDQKESIKTKRGKILPVLCVLSWIWLLLMAVYNVQAHLDGPMTAQEIENEKFKKLDAIEDDMGPMIIKMTQDTIEALDITNDNFTVLTWSESIGLGIGFIAVLLMYRLKKPGYYLYLLYTLVSLGVPLFYFFGNAAAMLGTIVLGAFSVLFVILYGVQLKRMG